MRLRIDEAIKKSGLKKGYIAKKLYVSPDTVTNWSWNKTMIPLDKAVKLARLLDCEIEDLFEEK